MAEIRECVGGGPLDGDLVAADPDGIIYPPRRKLSLQERKAINLREYTYVSMKDRITGERVWIYTGESDG